jgi:luciferase family oxidoreductase group 1
LVPLSILELGRVRQGSGRQAALYDARTLAAQAERWGYRRFWVAEHHNFKSVTTAATSLVIGHIAAGTARIRVGAGGIMLPNHAPYVIAEQFGTLATLFPGRIDLGLGRAPGTDALTLQALRRHPDNAEHFVEDVLELQAFLGPVQPGQRVEAIPGSGTEVPLWILGSSLYGAQVAAHLGLPFGFASHFAPQALDAALATYRRQFRPSREPGSPYALVGVNIIAADTDDEARWLATSQEMAFTDIVRGIRKETQPPIDDMDRYWTPQEKAEVSRMLACRIVGGPETVRSGVTALVDRTGADELMVVSDMFDFTKRLRSFEILAEVSGIRP